MSLLDTNLEDLTDNGTCSNKSVPKWLLELGFFDQKFEKSKAQNNSNILGTRPLTERNTLSSINHPKWLEQLNERRRMSDITDNISFSKENNNINCEIVNNKNQQEWMKFNQTSQTLYNNKSSPSSSAEMISSELKFPSDYYFSSSEIQDYRLTNESRASSSNDSKTSSHFSDVFDDHLFELTAAKSIENLKLERIFPTIEEECIIPEMPCGIELCLLLIENWGDEHYIGLNGIEILDKDGNKPKFKNISLFDSGNNRIQTLDLSKLVDNVFRTHDDDHIWQCRISQRQLPRKIVFTFEKPVTIALIRIWNHNKSRIHSCRGVKFLKIKLDDQTIFCGEIAKASGDLIGSVENFGDTILFTTDEKTLEQISHHDIMFQDLIIEQMT